MMIQGEDVMIPERKREKQDPSTWSSDERTRQKSQKLSLSSKGTIPRRTPRALVFTSVRFPSLRNFPHLMDGLCEGAASITKHVIRKHDDLVEKLRNCLFLLIFFILALVHDNLHLCFSCLWSSIHRLCPTHFFFFW